MFTTILVPLDGSRFAEAALPMALRLAAAAPAKLHLALAHQPVPALVGMGGMVLPPIDLDDDSRFQEGAYLAGMAADLSLAGAGPVDYRELDGPAGPAVCEAALRIGADLVVMATHGRGPGGRLWHGSVADHVVRHLTVPVLLVQPARMRAQRPDSALRGILVALDFSAESEAVLEPVHALAHLTRAHVTLVHVIVEPGIEQPPRAEAQRRLDQIADRLRARGLDVSTRVTAGIDPARTLRKALRESRIDLLALATHGAGGIRRLWKGSVAEKVVRGASKPILLLRPPPRTPLQEASCPKSPKS